jgi:hypothetical protein
MLFTHNVVSSTLIIFTLMMELLCSSEESVLTRGTRRHIQVDGILQNIKCFSLRNTDGTGILK